MWHKSLFLPHVTHIWFFYDSLNMTNQNFSVCGTESETYLTFFKANAVFNTRIGLHSIFSSVSWGRRVNKDTIKIILWVPPADWQKYCANALSLLSPVTAVVCLTPSPNSVTQTLRLGVCNVLEEPCGCICSLVQQQWRAGPLQSWTRSDLPSADNFV